MKIYITNKFIKLSFGKANLEKGRKLTTFLNTVCHQKAKDFSSQLPFEMGPWINIQDGCTN